MSLTAHEHLYGVDVERLGTTLPYGLGVYFGPNRITAAMALARENFEVRTQIDNLSVVASVEGSMDYQSLYQELQAYYVKFTLVKDESLPVKAKSHLVEDEPPLVEDRYPLLREMNQEPPSQRIQNIFLQQLRDIEQCAERNLRQHVRIAAISLPSYWYERPKSTVLGAATQLNMDIPSDMLLCHEETARLAYNLESLKEGTFLLVLVEYNTKNLYLTFTEMSDREDPEFHPKYPVAQYLLENLGEDSPTRAKPDAKHYTNIGKAFDQFILRHVTKYPHLIDKFSYYDIKGIILTGDASEGGMHAMDNILRQVFADLPQCSSGNIFTDLRPSHVVALGAARAVRSKMVNGDVLRDVYGPVAIEDSGNVWKNEKLNCVTINHEIVHK